MNIELITKVRDLVAEKPDENFNMNYWVKVLYGADKPEPFEVSQDGEIMTCGTAMCLAGWTLFVQEEMKPLEKEVICHTGYSDSHGVGRTAGELLELTEAQAKILFYRDNWPERYKFDIENEGIEGEEFWHEREHREGALMFLDEIIATGEEAFNERD